jgi:hypothetical protein
LACACPYEVILYGGAAGGGKSDWIIGTQAQREQAYGANYRGIIFRRSYPQLEEIESRALELFTPIYGSGIYRAGRKQFDFPSGGTLKLRSIEDDKDVYKYIGHQYTDINWDELTMWPNDFAFNYLMSRLRSAAGVPCRVRAATNPGGPGHHWVKRMFLKKEDGFTDQPRFEPQTVVGRSGSMLRKVFIPAKLSDNKVLMKNDPAYADRLDAIADPNIRRALRDGDWDILAGAALPELRGEVHLIRNVTPPPGVDTWCSCDWGYTKPYSVGFFFRNYDGCVVQWAELYGMGSKENEGNRESPARVMEKILHLEKEFGVICHERWLDAQHFNPEPGSPSIADMLGGAQLGWRPWAKGPGSRQARKTKLHEFLAVINGASRFVMCERCVHTWRTLVSLPLDPRNPEDVDTDAEDHCYDMVCGGLMKDVKTKAEMDRIVSNRRVAAQVEFGPPGSMGGW